MSGEVKRWFGSTAVAVLLVAVLAAGWWFVSASGDGGGGGPTGSGTSASPSPSVSPSSAASSSSPTASPSPSQSTSYINAAPGERPPVRPPDELGDAGLEAFVRYFALTMDWAVASMDPRLLAEASTAECGLCTVLVSDLKADVAAGRRIEGNRYTVTRVMAFPNMSGDHNARDAGLWVDATAYTLYEADGAIVSQDPPASNIEYSVGARFIGGRWSVVSLLITRRAA